MWLSIVFAGLVIAIAITQGTQGLYSAFVMTVLTICCAAAAFGTYEWVAIHWLAPNWKPDYALPVSLGVVFGVPLVLLRLLFDRVIRRACLLPAWVDRVGGGVFGLITGLTMVGIVAVCVRMIPFSDGAILGHSRVTVVNQSLRRTPGATPPAADAEERELWLTPDRFAAGLASVLSDGVFSGKESFYKHNPDLIQTIGWVAAAHAEVSRYAPPGSISIARVERVDVVYKMTPGDSRRDEPPEYEEEPPKAGHEFQMIRVKLRNEARDIRKSHNFTLRQFRLVGQSDKGGIRQYHPIAIQQEENDLRNRHIRYRKQGRKFWPVIDEMYVPREGNNNEVEIVFELPTGFKASFLEYKREARAAVTFERRKSQADARSSSGRRDRTVPTPTAAASLSRASSDAGAPRGSGRRRGGRVRTVTANRGGSRFSNDLPITMRSYRRLKNAEISRGALVGGHLVGDVDRQASGTDPLVSKFDVPRDKRLLQLNVGRLKARSALGRAISFAVATVQNYFVQDANGRRYKVVGKYAVATVGGRKVMEIQYFGNRVGSIGGIGKFSRINEKNLKRDDEFLLLFLVDPGARIVSFSTGGSASRSDDLTDENITAPR